MTPWEISTDPARLDLDWIVRSLQTTYWAEGRSAEVITASFKASLAFGAYLVTTGAQIGMARVVTDGATHAWLCDVFVEPAHRGKGLGKRLVEAVIAHPQVKDTRIYLGTRDAHGLYARYGFEPWQLMRRS